MLCQSLYGGRIDNEFDQRLLDAFVESLFCAESFASTFELAQGVKGPEGTRQEQFFKWINTLPGKNPPTWLGLPPRAEDMLLALSGASMLRKFALMQDAPDDATYERSTDVSVDADGKSSKDAVGASAAAPGSPSRRRSYVAAGSDNAVPTWISRLSQLADSWLTLLPEDLPRMERSLATANGPGAALFRCFDREAGVGLSLLSVIRKDLAKLQAVCSGEDKPTNLVRSLMEDLHRGAVPGRWGKYYASEDIAVGAWVADLALRLKQLSNLTRDGTLTDVAAEGVWLGGLFYPGAFVAATRQTEAQKLGVSLEELRLDITISDVGMPGYTVRGLALEGGATYVDGVLQLSSQMRQVLPDMNFAWMRKHDSGGAATGANKNTLVDVPVYLNATRLHFVLKIELPAAVTGGVWCQRGTALIAWAPDFVL